MLNVESGLNDGIATPIVLLAIAGVAGTGDRRGREARAGRVAACWWGRWPAVRSAGSAAS